MDFLIAYALLILCHSLFEIVIHYVTERAEIVLSIVAVNAIVDSYEADIVLGKVIVRVLTHFKIVSSETGGILNNDR